MQIDIPNIFKGTEVTIVGGGNSLRGFDFGKCLRPVIAVNDSFKLVDSSILVGIDAFWYKEQLEVDPECFNNYNGFIVTWNPCPVDHTFMHLDPQNNEIDRHVYEANLSGFTALALALHLGAEKVHLLGFDGGYSGKHGNHYREFTKVPSSTFENRNQYYEIFRGFPVVNYGEESLIECFEKKSIKEY